jgi:hypothetical protein
MEECSLLPILPKDHHLDLIDPKIVQRFEFGLSTDESIMDLFLERAWSIL